MASADSAYLIPIPSWIVSSNSMSSRPRVMTSEAYSTWSANLGAKEQSFCQAYQWQVNILVHKCTSSHEQICCVQVGPTFMIWLEGDAGCRFSMWEIKHLAWTPVIPNNVTVIAPNGYELPPPTDKTPYNHLLLLWVSSASILRRNKAPWSVPELHSYKCFCGDYIHTMA